jgi:hypothetical protein
MAPSALAAATGIPEAELACIAKAVKESTILHRAAAKRGLDVKGIVSAASSCQKVLAADPWAPVPPAIGGVARRKVEIDPGMAGLDRRIAVLFAEKDPAVLLDSAFQVGVEDAWTSIDMVGVRRVLPAGAQGNEAWNLHQSWNHLSAHLELRVEAMAQSINPSSLHLLRGVMDWGLWRLRAEYVVRHDEVIERFDSYRSRAIVESPRHDGTSSTAGALEHEIAAQLVGGTAGGDRDVAAEYHRKHAWAPFVSFDPAWRDEWLDRVVLVLYDPPVQGQRQLDAFANMFPVATLYIGECKVSLGAGKVQNRRAAIVDALVPKSNLTIMTEHVAAVASIISPDLVIMPECTTHVIPYPAGYPAGDITRVYRPGGRRASAVREKQICSFEEHWASQQEVDR